MEDAYDYEFGLLAGEQDRGGFLPRLRGRRFNVAVFLAAWGVAGLLSTTIPGLAANPDHVLIYFVFLVAAVLLVFLSIAAPDLPVAERAAARLEGLIGAML